MFSYSMKPVGMSPAYPARIDANSGRDARTLATVALDALERGPRLREVAARDGRSHDDDERRPVLALVVAVGVVVAAGLVGLLAKALLDVLDGHRRARVVEQLVGLLRDLVVPARVHVVAELLELLEIEKEPRARQKEAPRLLRPVLGARDGVGADRHERRHERIAHRPQRGAVGAVEEDHRRLRARRPGLDPVELDDARLVVRQELRRSGYAARGATRRPRRRPSRARPAAAAPRAA